MWLMSTAFQYLAHTTCLEVFSTLRDIYGVSNIVVAGLSLLSSILLSVCLHFFIEKPFAKRKLVIEKR